ncbi:MAG: hypothetical protein O7A09_05820 [Proteobacteria bacterium]|nr:hypothetical protein [Pseudomonadota bacterium]
MRERSRWIGLWLLGLGLGVLACAPSAWAGDERPTEITYQTPGAFPLLAPSYRRIDHQVVLITNHGLKPATTRLVEGQLVAWVSDARVSSRIVFEREVARSMICHSVVNFSIEEDELVSASLQAGEYASFCQLKPGRYRYKVIRDGHERREGVEAARRLEGVILVEQAG